MSVSPKTTGNKPKDKAKWGNTTVTTTSTAVPSKEVASKSKITLLGFCGAITSIEPKDAVLKQTSNSATVNWYKTTGTVTFTIDGNSLPKDSKLKGTSAKKTITITDKRVVKQTVTPCTNGCADQFRHIRRNHQHRHSLPGVAPDKIVDGFLGADVDAARRLVDQEDPGVAADPHGQEDLLLIAAGKLLDKLIDVRCFDLEFLPVFRRVLPALPELHKAVPRQTVDVGSQHIVRDRHPQKQPLVLPVLRDVGQLLPLGAAGGVNMDLFSVQIQLPALRAVPPASSTDLTMA